MTPTELMAKRLEEYKSSKIAGLLNDIAELKHKGAVKISEIENEIKEIEKLEFIPSRNDYLVYGGTACSTSLNGF